MVLGLSQRTDLRNCHFSEPTNQVQKYFYSPRQKANLLQRQAKQNTNTKVLSHLPVRWHSPFCNLIINSIIRSFQGAYLGEYKCTVIGLGLLLFLQFLHRLHRGGYKCTVISLGLLLCLQFLYRLRRRVQVYCNQSRFTTLSAVSPQATQAGTSVL